MVKSKLNIVLFILSVGFVSLIVALFIFESVQINQKKEISFDNFTIIKNSLEDGDIPELSSILLKYNENMPNLKSVYIKNEKNIPIYYFSTNNKDTLEDIADLFKKSKTIFDIYYNDKILISKNIYKIDASFSILSKDNVFLIFQKFTVLIGLYLLLVVSIIFYLHNTKDNNSKYSENKNDFISFPEQKITDELKKSASFDHDIVLVLVGSPHNFIKENSLEFLENLNKYFPFHDLILRYDDNTFCILLPNIDLEKGIQQIEVFDQTFVNINSKSLKFPIMFGLSSRNGRLISGNIILKEAKAALKKAMSDKSYPIIGFRPNPALYREYLSNLKQK